MEKNKAGPFLKPCTKINHNRRENGSYAEMSRLNNLEENIQETLCDFGRAKISQNTKNANHKWKKLINWISTKFTTSTLLKYHYRKEKESTDEEAIFAIHKPDKGLVPKIYNEHLQLNNKTKTQLKIGRRFEQTLH